MHAWTYIEENFRRPFQDRTLRAILAYTIPRPWLFRAALYAARLTRPLSRFLPSRLSPLFELVPDRLPPKTQLRSFYPSNGKARHRFALLSGCAQQVLSSGAKFDGEEMRFVPGDTGDAEAGMWCLYGR
jgi:glycolate oxidase iron-sulfur subunit